MEVQIFLAIIQGIFTLLIGRLGLKLKKHEARKEREEDESKAIKRGLQAVLRDRILQAYNYYRKVGGITTAQMENITSMYRAYHNLGGNGVVTKIYKQAMALPHIAGDDT